MWKFPGSQRNDSKIQVSRGPAVAKFIRVTWEKGQWLFLVPLIGGRYHTIPQLAVYTTYIPLIVLANWVIIWYRSHQLKGTRFHSIEKGWKKLGKTTRPEAEAHPKRTIRPNHRLFPRKPREHREEGRQLGTDARKLSPSLGQGCHGSVKKSPRVGCGSSRKCFLVEVRWFFLFTGSFEIVFKHAQNCIKILPCFKCRCNHISSAKIHCRQLHFLLQTQASSLAALLQGAW